MRSELFKAMVILLALGGTSPAIAQDELLVTSESFEGDLENGVSRFFGNAGISRGSLDIKAEEIRLLTKNGEVVAATLTGTPVSFRQAPEGQAPVAGEARRLEYDAASETITLTGKAWLTHGGDRFEGETIRYDLTSRKVTAQSDKTTPERVRFVLTPRKKPDGKAAEKSETGSEQEQKP